MKKTSIFCLVILLVAVLLFAACGPQVTPPEAEKVIRIGCANDMTGPYGSITIGMFHAFVDAFTYANEEQGGINGLRTEVLWVDDRSDAAKVISAYRRFKERGIVAQFAQTSVESVALKPYLERDEIPGYGSASDIVSITPPGWFYCAYITSFQQLAVSLRWYYENEWKKKGFDGPIKVGTIAWDNAFGRANIEPLLKWAEEQGMVEVVVSLWPTATAMDYTTEWQTIKAKKPDLVITISGGAAPGMIIRDADRAGIPMDLPIMMEPCGLIKPCFEIGGAGYSRVVTAWMGATLHEDLPGVKLAHEITMRYRGHEVESISDLCVFEQAWVLQEAIKRAMDAVGYENLTGAAVKKYGLDTINGDVDVGGMCPRPSFCDYPGDRVLNESARVVRADAIAMELIPISDWIDCPHIGEFGFE